jgi:hypothetical protein
LNDRKPAMIMSRELGRFEIMSMFLSMVMKGVVCEFQEAAAVVFYSEEMQLFCRLLDSWERLCLSVQKTKTDRENHSLTGKLSRDNEIKEKDWRNGRTYNQELSIVLNQEEKEKI